MAPQAPGGREAAAARAERVVRTWLAEDCRADDLDWLMGQRIYRRLAALIEEELGDG